MSKPNVGENSKGTGVATETAPSVKSARAEVVSSPRKIRLEVL